MRISTNMLTCSAKLYTPGELDEDRNPVYSDPVQLSKVYLNTTLGQINGAQGKQPSDNAILYYDCFNSLPKGLTFSKGSKVVFEGNEFYINSINPCYSNGLEHYEIGLI